ncbi:MAG TPA: hypothetical protein VHC48_15730 [Puia sp.]|jgi:hypothetical protein|nr:hypothetical protein [Puia sp.]
MKLFLPSFAAMLLLASCDWSYTLVVNNTTGKTQRIKYVDFYRYPPRDSIRTWADTTATCCGDRVHGAFIPMYKDTVERSVSLSLDNGRSAELEWGINGSINPRSKIIVNETDTIHLSGDKRARLAKTGIKAFSGFVSLK